MPPELRNQLRICAGVFFDSLPCALPEGLRDRFIVACVEASWHVMVDLARQHRVTLRQALEEKDPLPQVVEDDAPLRLREWWDFWDAHSSEDLLFLVKDLDTENAPFVPLFFLNRILSLR